MLRKFESKTKTNITSIAVGQVRDEGIPDWDGPGATRKSGEIVQRCHQYKSDLVPFFLC